MPVPEKLSSIMKKTCLIGRLIRFSLKRPDSLTPTSIKWLLQT